MKSIALLLLSAAGVQAQTACLNDSNGDGRVGVDGAVHRVTLAHKCTDTTWLSHL